MPRKLGQVCGFFSVKDGKKTCAVCKKEKGVSEFSTYAYTTNGGCRSIRILSRCRPCQEDKRRERIKKNPQKYAHKHKDWQLRNKEHVKNYSKKYRERPDARARHTQSQTLREKKIRLSKLSLTKEERRRIDLIYIEAKRVEALISICPLFDDPFLGKKVNVDHIIPVSKGGQHHPDNLQIMLKTQNSRKGSKCPSSM